MELDNLDIFLIQETMEEYRLIFELKKTLGGWEFLTLDSKGFSMGLIIGWNQNISLINSLSIHSGLCIKILSKSLGVNLTLLNVCGPYEGKQTY